MTIQQDSKKATRNTNLYMLESIWHGTNCTLILTKQPPCIKRKIFSIYFHRAHEFFKLLFIKQNKFEIKTQRLKLVQLSW